MHCNAHARWSHFGKLTEINTLLNKECSLESIAEAEMITKAQFGVRTTIICQLFGVSGSAVSCDMQNYFEY
jgi:hypothetical protein